MYFDINGNMDVSRMLSSKNGSIDRTKFCEQIINNNLSIDGFALSSEVKMWKTFYEEMHPKIRICEDIARKGLTKDETLMLFAKFFKPMRADCCTVTIVDPYLFAKTLNSDDLCEVLIKNVLSKSVRFLTNSRNDDKNVKSSVKHKLENVGFSTNFIDCKESHDRYWFTRVNGFVVGTSFSGIGNKCSTFSVLNQNDLNDIVKIFGV